MERQTAESGGTSHPGRCSLRARYIGGLDCQCHDALPYLGPKTCSWSLLRTRYGHYLHNKEGHVILVAQSHTSKGLTRLCGTGEAIARAPGGHLGRALLYHRSPPVATRGAFAFPRIRRTDSRWEEDPSGTRFETSRESFNEMANLLTYLKGSQ